MIKTPLQVPHIYIVLIARTGPGISTLRLAPVTSAGRQSDEAEVSAFLDEEVTAMLRGSGELIRKNE